MKNSFSRFFGLGEKEEQIEVDKLNETGELTEIVEEKEGNEEIKKIPIYHIVPNRFQPRTVFDEEKLKNYPERFIHMGSFNRLSFREFEEDNLKLLRGNADGGQ